MKIERESDNVNFHYIRIPIPNGSYAILVFLDDNSRIDPFICRNHNQSEYIVEVTNGQSEYIVEFTNARVDRLCISQSDIHVNMKIVDTSYNYMRFRTRSVGAIRNLWKLLCLKAVRQDTN